MSKQKQQVWRTIWQRRRTIRRDRRDGEIVANGVRREWDRLDGEMVANGDRRDGEIVANGDRCDGDGNSVANG